MYANRGLELECFMSNLGKRNIQIPSLLARQTKRYRKEAGLTQEVLAERCLVSNAYLSKIEAGVANPPLLLLCVLATNLNVDLQTLLGN